MVAHIPKEKQRQRKIKAGNGTENDGRAGKASLTWSHLNERKKVRMFQSEGTASGKGESLGGGEDGNKASVTKVE